MKNFIITLMTFIPMSLFACPDLQGQYRCKGKSFDVWMKTKISQGKDFRGHYLILANGQSKIYLDGKERPIKEVSRAAKYSATCTKKTVLMKVKDQGHILENKIIKTKFGYTLEEIVNSKVVAKETCKKA